MGPQHASLLHSHVTEFILVPICEDGLGRLLEGAIWRARLVERLMEAYVPLARPRSDRNSDDDDDKLSDKQLAFCCYV